MWADNETTTDLLGFRVHADLVRSIVTDRSLLPVTIGIFGDWGSGKTSVMRMVQEDLEQLENRQGSAEVAPPNEIPPENIACLYFNGWLFEGYDDAKSAILSTIIQQLEEHQKFGAKVKESAGSLLKSINWMRLARMGFEEVALPATAAYLTGGATSIIQQGKKLMESGEKNLEEGDLELGELVDVDTAGSVTTGVRTFRERFGEMLESAGIEALVVLIDDLDRCSPERIVANLEAIKLFLSVDRTAFVIGADPRIVRHAISQVYGPDDIQSEADEYASQTDVVTDYLEKVIQVPYRLPRLSPAEVETYMSLLFCERHLEESSFESLLEAYRDHRETDRYSVFGYGAINDAYDEALPESIAESLSFCSKAAPLITEGLKGNPRQVKRFLNTFVLRKKLARVANLENIRDSVLVKLMILEYAHPTQFNQLYEWQSAEKGHPEKLEQLEEELDDTGELDEEDARKVHQDWGGTFIRRWIQMEPRLSDVDLRDYFWVARDRLQTVLSDASMVPPVVRQAAEHLLSGNTTREKEATNLLDEFDSDEEAALVELVKDHAIRHPEEGDGFTALINLVEEGVPGSVEGLRRALKTSPPAQLPPSLGPRIVMLLKSDRDLESRLEPELENLRNSDERIGRALSSSS